MIVEKPGKKIAYFHASKFGNGEKVAEEFQRLMADRGVEVEVRHIAHARAKDMPYADLYLFSAPGRMGKPRGKMRRFLRRANLPAGTRCAVLTTEGAPRPDPKTGKMPDPAAAEKWQRVIPVMLKILEAKGLKCVAEGKVLVTGMKGPLEEEWERKVAAYVDKLAPQV
ncbi:MAG: hypothetical protein JXA62_04475 [Candidatus Aminicenantes bacterium]|nr:hypothetical protein [Candidatus Aminicenantes bacterium]